jgi:hypothetical protein
MHARLPIPGTFFELWTRKADVGKRTTFVVNKEYRSAELSKKRKGNATRVSWNLHPI